MKCKTVWFGDTMVTTPPTSGIVGNNTSPGLSGNDRSFLDSVQ